LPQLRTPILNLTRQEVALSSDPSSLANQEKITEAVVDLNEAKEESLGKQTELQNKLNELQREAAEIVKAQRDRFAELLKGLTETITDKRIEEADPITRLRLQGDIALDGLAKQRDELVNLANKLGEPTDAIEAQFAELIEATKREIERAKREIETEQLQQLQYQPKFDTDLGLLSNETKTQTRLIFDAVTGQIKEVTEKELPPIPLTIDFAPSTEDNESAREVVDNFLAAIDAALNDEDYDFASAIFGENAADNLNNAVRDLIAAIDSEGIGIQLSNTFSAAANAIGFLNRGIQDQIAELEELNRVREQNINDLEDQLEREEERQKLGLANNLEAVQQSLNAELKAKEEANQQAIDLKRKQAIQERNQNILQQASEFSLAISKVFSAHSGIPFVGVLLAAGFVASMIATIKNANSQLKSLNKAYMGS
jgi:DNA repair exonuclease SbcCD ATPase subunit